MQISIANIVGAGINPTSVVVNVYVTRVTADGGICEGVQCLISAIQELI